MFKTIFGSIAVLFALTCWLFAGAARAEGPSFDCGKVEAGSIEEMVCKDTGLAALDRRLAEVYAAAAKKAVNEHPPILKAEQRGWIKGRNDCWKSADRRKCVADNYRLRITELQAKYRLVPSTVNIRGHHTSFSASLVSRLFAVSILYPVFFQLSNKSFTSQWSTGSFVRQRVADYGSRPPPGQGR